MNEISSTQQMKMVNSNSVNMFILKKKNASENENAHGKSQREHW